LNKYFQKKCGMKKIALLLTGAVIFLSACEKAIIGNDQVIHQEKILPSFTDVLSNGDFDITVKPSPRYFITINGESNILSEIETIVRGANDLYIQYRSGANIGRHQRVSIILEAPIFKNLKVNGSGNFTSLDTLRSDYFSTTISGSGKVDVLVKSQTVGADIFGSGDIYLRGISEVNGLRISGSGNIKAFNLESKTTNARISGSGNIEARAKDFLRAEINGSGMIMYKGNPQVETFVSGSGTVRHIQ
jgi:Putative auto-transporter adhesin, head GIN domain